jgi:hypothetical protein
VSPCPRDGRRLTSTINQNLPIPINEWHHLVNHLLVDVLKGFIFRGIEFRHFAVGKGVVPYANVGVMPVEFGLEDSAKFPAVLGDVGGKGKDVEDGVGVDCGHGWGSEGDDGKRSSLVYDLERNSGGLRSEQRRERKNELT